MNTFQVILEEETLLKEDIVHRIPEWVGLKETLKIISFLDLPLEG